VSLELRMYVGAEDVAADRVIVHGVPDVEMVNKRRRPRRSRHRSDGGELDPARVSAPVRAC